MPRHDVPVSVRFGAKQIINDFLVVGARPPALAVELAAAEAAVRASALFCGTMHDLRSRL